MKQKEGATYPIHSGTPSGIRLLSILMIIALAVISYLLVIRPWHVRWGATDHEVAQAMPGDEVVADASFSFTRAVTIKASAEEIWPWIVQLGDQRAGFYAYDWFDNRGVRSAEKIMPELQSLEVGDAIPISSVVIYRVWSMADNQYVVWVSDDDPPSGAWTWALYAKDGEQTRLVTRLRGKMEWNSPKIAFALLLDAGDFVFMRKSMSGIKQRAEGMIIDSYAADVTEGVLWGMSLVEFIAAIVLIFRRRKWWVPWLSAFGAASVFLTIFYLRPPIWMMIGLVSVVMGGLILSYRTPSNR